MKENFEIILQDGTKLKSGDECATKNNSNNKLIIIRYNEQTNDCECYDKNNNKEIYHKHVLCKYTPQVTGGMYFM